MLDTALLQQCSDALRRNPDIVASYHTGCTSFDNLLAWLHGEVGHAPGLELYVLTLLGPEE